MSDLFPATAPSRHDLLLAVIAAPLVLAGVLSAALPISLPLALAVGSVPAGSGLGYALFWRPPAARSV